jgi:hypothetical protein
MSHEWIQEFIKVNDEYSAKCQLLDNELQHSLEACMGKDLLVALREGMPQGLILEELPEQTASYVWLSEQFAKDFGPTPKIPEPHEEESEEYRRWREGTTNRLQRVVTGRYVLDIDEPGRFEEAVKRLQDAVFTMGAELLLKGKNKVTLVEGPRIYPKREGYKLSMYAWATFYHHLEDSE